MFHPTVVVSIQMIVVFEEISKKQFCVIVLEFIFYLYEILFSVKDEFLQFCFKVLKERIVSESKLNHISRIIYFFVSIEHIEPLQIFTFFVADNGLLCFVLLMCSTKSHGLTMTTFTFDKYLSLAWKIITLLISVTKLCA